MSRFFLLILLFLNCSANADPKVLPLKNFNSLVTATVNGVEGGSQLYLASSDENQFLKNIQITTGGTTVTLDTLNYYNANGTPKSLLIAGDLIINSTNVDTITEMLTGYLYVTTKQQAADTNFFVYVIKCSHTISTMAMKSTVVILNTQLKSNSNDIDKPPKASYVTGINQSPNTNLYFKWGIPPANWYDITNNTFFMNPVNFKQIWDDNIFFPHVEPLQIGLDYWYFTVMGPVNMTIENNYVNNQNYTTTAVNTTGLIVNELLFQQHVVNFQSDATRSATSGTYTSAYITGDLRIILEGYSSKIGNSLNHENEIENLVWSPTIRPIKLTINSTVYLPGTFYCQYFTFTGDFLPTTIPQPTTLPPTTVSTTNVVTSTTTVVTTTKRSASLAGMKLIILLFVSAMLF